MNLLYTACIASLFFISCGTHLSYVGSSFTATSKVDVYVDAASIKKPYTVIGKGYAEYSIHARRRMDITQAKALEKAREHGADAVLFQEYFFTQEGSSIHSVSESDSTATGWITVKNATVSPLISSRMDILFLKYN